MSRLETRRFDGKLDSFLRRSLPSEDYERICTSELCVVVSPEEKRVHRHVVLGHHCLYLTEFPPKSVKVAVNLQDVQSICMLDDLAEFLSGKEQEETVHIQICYRRVMKEKSLLETLGEKSPMTLKRKLKRGEPSLSRSGGAFGSQELQLNTSSGSSSLSSIKKGSLQQHYQQERDCSLSPISLQTSPNQFLPNGLNLSTRSDHGKSPKERSFGSPKTAIESPLLNSTNDSFKFATHSELAASSNSICSATPSPDLSEISPLMVQNHSKPPLYHHLPSSPDIFSSTLSLNDMKPLSSSSLSLASTDRLNTLDNGPSSFRKKTETAILDLYVLKQNTDFYHQLCVMWEDFNIALLLSDGSAGPLKSSSTSLSNDHFFQHYCTLKQELLAAKSIETGAKLALELCTACQKYWVIKKLFWEDSELLEFCTEQLISHLSPKGMRINCTRADEIEYSIILMDLLYQMLRETHLLPRRLTVLTRNDGQLLLALATAVVDLLPKHKSLHFQTADFDEELTEKSCGVLIELVRVTQQARWPQARKSTVCVCWLVETISTLPNTPNCCSRLVDYACSVLSGGRGSVVLEPQRLVTLYHIATLLETYVQNSPTLVQLMRSNFMEEFRYFISISRAKQTLPKSSPLSQTTLELLHSTKSRILQR